MNQALNDEEIERLAARLSDNPNPGALSLEAVDGLFCALIASPDLVGLSEYLPVILGGDPGNSLTFRDNKDASDTVSLLMRHWNSIVADFEGGDHIHLPYVKEPGIDNISGRDWARGFMRGTRLAPVGWSRIFRDEKEGLTITIPLVAGEIDTDWPKEPLTTERSEELLQWMCAGAARAYRYFEADRRAAADQSRFHAAADDHDFPETYVRPARKIGRNEPCPCGSGAKYKKCCGATNSGPPH